MHSTRMPSHRSDGKSLVSQMEYQEKQLIEKRRWLMGLPPLKDEMPRFLNDRFVPESLLREDDLFLDTVNAYVQDRYGIIDRERRNMMTGVMLGFSSKELVKCLLSVLDEFTNKGLYNLAELLAGGSVNFGKTRKEMKKLIKEYLIKMVKARSHDSHNISMKLSELLENQNNFKNNDIQPAESNHTFVMKVVEGLENLPFQALDAMRCKLRNEHVNPQFRRFKSGRSRDGLVHQVRKNCLRMLSELGEGDELQEPLAKAVAVATLSSRLGQSYHSGAALDHFSFRPEIKALQNDILQAIWLLEKKLRFSHLKKIQLVIDPHAVVSSRSLRTRIKKMLIGYLFECDDMKAIPEVLLETLAIINKTYRRQWKIQSPEEEIEKEVECILSLSAQMKQMLWHFFPPHCGFDEDFSNAYIEDLQESDDDYDDNGCDDESDSMILESIGESSPADCAQLPFSEKGIDVLLASSVNGDVIEPGDSNENVVVHEKNRYLDLQGVCDGVSMMAHGLIGRSLELLAEAEGWSLDFDTETYLRGSSVVSPKVQGQGICDDHVSGEMVILHAVQEIIPSFTKDKLEKVKRLTGFK